MELVEIKEGLGKFLISPTSMDDNIPRRSDTVFFNAHQEINRDFSVLAVRAYAKTNEKSGLTICEPLCGSGIRSCRYAIETPSLSIYCNDLNLNAIEVAKKNYNRLSKEFFEKIHLSNMEGNLFLQKLNLNDLIFDFVDIDPYGTPIPFVQSSIQLVTTQGLLAFTATDLASLVGLYPRALYAKYSLSHFDKRIGNVHEIATRALIAGIQHVGLTLNQSLIPILSLYHRHLTLNQSLIPILSLYHRHFIRSFFIRYRGVDRVIDQTGFIYFCKICQTRYSSSIEKKNVSCPNCNTTTGFKIGPLYLGPIQDKDYLLKMQYDKHLTKLGARKKLLKLILLMLEESSINIPWSYEIPNIAQKIGTTVPAINAVISKLKELGFDSYKTHFSGTSLKTNAQEPVIKSVVNSLKK
jgi:tRNA (guanine26-N2/guanine27-N2)-dimethyltransferase